MKQETDSKSFVTGTHITLPGAYLKGIREKKHIPLQDVQRQLGLTRALIDALESDDAQRLPGPVYVKGYLERYAKVVGVRVAPVLAGYQSFLEDNLLIEIQPREEPPQRPLRLMIGSAFAFLLATSLVFGAILSESDGLPKHGVEQPASGQGLEVDAVNTIPQDDENYLKMTFSTDSWVEVVDARDHILAVSLQREGTSLALEGKPPFVITLGHGPGVSVSYLGQTVPFEYDAKSYAAKLVVGK